MQIVFDRYAAEERIPVSRYLKNKKPAKYFSRETAAAVVSAGKLLAVCEVAEDIPVYYATHFIAYEDYGLAQIAANSVDHNGLFSLSAFMGPGIAHVSPLNQFKVLQNMPLSFVSIVYGLSGDNAVIYQSAAALLQQALYAPGQGPVLLGSGKVDKHGYAEAGFAVLERAEAAASPFLAGDHEAIAMFRTWAEDSTCSA